MNTMFSAKKSKSEVRCKRETVCVSKNGTEDLINTDVVSKNLFVYLISPTIWALHITYQLKL